MDDDNKIIVGLEDSIAHVRGDASRARVSTVQVPRDIDVRAIRLGSGLSQEEFASCFGFPVATLRNWEQGHRKPERTARILFTLIERIPNEVKRALHAA